MTLKAYETKVNITFASEDRTVFAGDVVELTEGRAKEINEKFALTFPEHKHGILVPVGYEQPVDNDQEPVDNVPEEKPKRTRAKSKKTDEPAE